MIICHNCGVELEPDMILCPLCQQPSTEEDNARINPAPGGHAMKSPEPVRLRINPLRKAAWELVSVILLMVVVISTLLNLILNREISWSEYPVAVSLVLFSYITLLLSGNRKIIRFLWVTITASVLILGLDTLTDSKAWALTLGIPLLFSFNVILALLSLVIRNSLSAGFNLIAYTLAAAALFCVCIEGITDYYSNGSISLVWSMIISACIMPVVGLLLFVHFRLGSSNNLNRIFHI